MDSKSLLTSVLGLKNSGWFIEDTELDDTKRIITVQLKYRSDTKLLCPECSTNCSNSIYDHSERTWRHKDLCEYETIFKASVPRVHCKKCDKITLVAVPWAEKKMRITFSFERILVNGCILMPIQDVCSLHRVSWYTVRHALERTIEIQRQKKSYDTVQVIGIDEIAIRKGHEYLTLVYDLAKSEVIWIGRERTYQTILDFVAWFGEERFRSIETICCDMWDPYIKGITQFHEPSKIVFDKFHIKKHLNDAVNKVRNWEHGILKGEQNNILANTKYLWLKNASNLTESQHATFKELRKTNLKVLRAYELKELFNHFWQYRSPGWAIRFFKDWYWAATHSRLVPIIRVARMLRRYWYGVLSYVSNPITNARSEGINCKIRVFTKRAFGFRTFDMFKNIIFLGCGGLQIDPFKSE